jgi:DNA primase
MIVVEGYMDVIALHQAGFDNSIASLGTAFTGGHGHLIKRYVDEVVVAFDSDRAGVNATLRSIPILKSAGLIVRVLIMNDYKDPDEFIQNKGNEAFEELIKAAMPSFMFEIRQLSKRYDLSDPEYKTRFSEDVAKKLLTIEGKLERDNYIEAILKAYDIGKEGLMELLGKYGKNIGIVQKNITSRDLNREEKRLKHKEDAVTIAQKEFLAIIVSHKQIYNKVKDIVNPEHFAHETLQKVGLIIYDIYEKGIDIEPALIMNKFTQIDDQKLIASIFGEEIKIENQLQLEKLLNDTIRSIKNEYLDARQKTITDPNGLMELIKEKKELLHLYVRLEDIDRRD